MKAIFTKIIKFFDQFIKFSVVGVVNTAIYFGVYYLLLLFKVGHIPANIIGYFAGSINGYLMSRFWVFKKVKSDTKQSMLKFYVVYGSSWVLSTLLVYLFVDIMHISDKIAPLLTICVTMPYNYVLQKIWTFSEKKQHDNDASESKQNV